MKFVENSYNKFLRTMFTVANPIKKSFKRTECKVHLFINNASLTILKNDGYLDEYNFFRQYINEIDQGAVWTDQDFKSSTHFYNPSKKRGLYGRKSAMDIGLEYYNESLRLWKVGKAQESLFYFGATLHIIQDMTVYQHANIRLLDQHHKYERYVITTYEHVADFRAYTGTYILESIEDYIRFNSRVAIRIQKKFRNIENDDTRFYRISRCGLPLAERTTAGAMVMFFNEKDKR